MRLINRDILISIILALLLLCLLVLVDRPW